MVFKLKFSIRSRPQNSFASQDKQLQSFSQKTDILLLPLCAFAIEVRKSIFPDRDEIADLSNRQDFAVLQYSFSFLEEDFLLQSNIYSILKSYADIFDALGDFDVSFDVVYLQHL